MLVHSELLSCMHLDPGYALFSVQNCLSCLELFRMMDIHFNETLNDCQFREFIKAFTDLNLSQADTLFELLDVDHSGEMDFGEFYLVFCILVASKDQYEKEFIYRHSPNIFQLIDADCSTLISATEFQQMGVLFNFDYNAIHRIFDEFDVSGDKNLDFQEFRLFTMACIDEQRSFEATVRVKVLSAYHIKLLRTLELFIRIYIMSHKLPQPRHIEGILGHLSDPYIPITKRRYSFFDWKFILSNLRIKEIVMPRRVRKIRKCVWKIIRFLCCFFCFCTIIKKVKDACRGNPISKSWNKMRRRHNRKALAKGHFRHTHNSYLTWKRDYGDEHYHEGVNSNGGQKAVIQKGDLLEEDELDFKQERNLLRPDS